MWFTDYTTSPGMTQKNIQIEARYSLGKWPYQKNLSKVSSYQLK